MHCFRVPSRLRADSEEDSNASLKSGGKSENSAPREQLMAHSSDASSRKSNFSMRVKGRKLGGIRQTQKIAQLNNNLTTDL